MRLTCLLLSIAILAACNSSEPEPTAVQIRGTEVKQAATLSSPTEPVSTDSPTETAAPTEAASPTVVPSETATLPAEVKPTISSVSPTKSAPPNGEPVIVFEQAGGYAGIMQTWLIYSDGTIRTEGKPDCQVEVESVDDILAEAEAIGFYDMSYQSAPGICCDFFSFTMTIQTEDGVNTVEVSDGDQKMSQDLRDLLTSMQQIVNSCNS